MKDLIFALMFFLSDFEFSGVFYLSSEEKFEYTWDARMNGAPPGSGDRRFILGDYRAAGTLGFARSKIFSGEAFAKAPAAEGRLGWTLSSSPIFFVFFLISRIY